MGFTDAVEELKSLLVGAPVEARNAAIRFVKRPAQSRVMVPEVYPAPRTRDPSRLLQASDLFLELLAAARAADWQRVIVISHSYFPPVSDAPLYVGDPVVPLSAA